MLNYLVTPRDHFIPKGIQKLELSQGGGADFCVWSEGHCQRQGPKRRPKMCCQADAGVSQFLIHEGYICRMQEDYRDPCVYSGFHKVISADYLDDEVDPGQWVKLDNGLVIELKWYEGLITKDDIVGVYLYQEGRSYEKKKLQIVKFDENGEVVYELHFSEHGDSFYRN